MPVSRRRSTDGTKYQKTKFKTCDELSDINSSRQVPVPQCSLHHIQGSRHQIHGLCPNSIEHSSPTTTYFPCHPSIPALHPTLFPFVDVPLSTRWSASSAVCLSPLSRIAQSSLSCLRSSDHSGVLDIDHHKRCSRVGEPPRICCPTIWGCIRPWPPPSPSASLPMVYISIFSLISMFFMEC